MGRKESNQTKQTKATKQKTEFRRHYMTSQCRKCPQNQSRLFTGRLARGNSVDKAAPANTAFIKL